MKGTPWKNVNELMESVDWGAVDPDTLVYKVLCAGSPGGKLNIAGGWPSESQAIAHARVLVLSRQTLNARAEVYHQDDLTQPLYVVDRHQGVDQRVWRATPRQRLSPLAAPAEPARPRTPSASSAEPEGPGL